MAGQGPDLIYGPADNVGVLVTTKTILPLEKIFDDEFFSRFTPQGLVSWKGSRWLAADQIGNHLTLVYHPDLVPVPPATFDDLIKIGQQLTKSAAGNDRASQYGLTWNYREPFFFIPFLTAFGGWVMDEHGRPTLDNENTVRAIQFVLDLRDKYKIIPREGDYEIADMLFKESRTGMIINGPWSWTGYHVPQNSRVAPLPFNSETGLWAEPMISAKGYAVNANVLGGEIAGDSQCHRFPDQRGGADRNGDAARYDTGRSDGHRFASGKIKSDIAGLHAAD